MQGGPETLKGTSKPAPARSKPNQPPKFFDADAAGVGGPKQQGVFGQPVLDAVTGNQTAPMFHEPVDVKGPKPEPVKASAAAVDPKNTAEMFPAKEQPRLKGELHTDPGPPADLTRVRNGESESQYIDRLTDELRTENGRRAQELREDGDGPGYDRFNQQAREHYQARIAELKREYASQRPPVQPEPSPAPAPTPPKPPAATPPAGVSSAQGQTGQAGQATGQATGQVVVDNDLSNMSEAEKAKRFGAGVRDAIRKAPSYPALLKAALAHHKSLGYDADHIARRAEEYAASPEDLLAAHAGVMNAKSGRAKTLLDLANQVVKEARVPLDRSYNKFRGDSFRVDWDTVAKSRAAEPLRGAATAPSIPDRAALEKMTPKQVAEIAKANGVPLSKKSANIDGLMTIRGARAKKQAGVDEDVKFAVNDSGDGETPSVERRIKANQFEGGNVAEVRKAALRWALDNIRGSYRNDETGWDIEVRREGLEKIASAGKRAERIARAHFDAITAIPETLKFARLVESRPDRGGNPDIRQIHIFRSGLTVGDQSFNVRLTVKETIQGKRLYDHSLTEIEEPAAKAGPPSTSGEAGAVGQTPTAGSPSNSMPPDTNRGNKNPTPGNDPQFAVNAPAETSAETSDPRAGVMLKSPSRGTTPIALSYMGVGHYEDGENSDLWWVDKSGKMHSRKVEGERDRHALYAGAEDRRLWGRIDRKHKLISLATHPDRPASVHHARYVARQLREKYPGYRIQEFNRTPLGVGDDDAMFAVNEPNAQGFYSHLARTLEQKMPNRASPDQIRGIIAGGQVKQDEIRWSGIEDWLREQGGKPVTKEQVREFLAANEVKVEEVTKGVVDDSEIEAWWNDEGGANEEKPFNELTPEQVQEARSRYAEEVGRFAENGTATKFYQYVLPGGENYKEVLFTLPNKPSRIPSDKYRVEEVHYDDGARYFAVTPNSRSAAHRTREAAEAELARRPRFEDQADIKSQQYKSSHWDEPNVLAHVRMNDRTDADGKRVLFVEEIQSDWHQAGREKGYRPDNEARLAALAKRRDELMALGRDATPEQKQEWADVSNQIRDLPSDPGVPDAPFAKTWHEYALRRVLRMAAENGYDKVAWAPGDVQAERYDLSRQVSSIEYAPGPRRLLARKDNENVIAEENVAPEKLADYIGKDAAQKLLATPPVRRSNSDWHTLSGVDLKIGGEGMKGFYDKIIPEYLNKYGKKWAARVGTRPFDTGGGQFLTDEEVNRYGTDMDIAQVPSIDITPTMKKSVMEDGQPMFAMNADPAFSVDGQPGTPENDQRDQASLDDIRRQLKSKFGVDTPIEWVAGPGAGDNQRLRPADPVGWVGDSVAHESDRRGVEALAQLLGRPVRWFTADRRVQGFRKSGYIAINADSPTAHLAIFGHEFSHDIEANAPDLHGPLVAAVRALDPEAFDEAAKKKQAIGYKSPDNARVEVLADTMGDHFLKPEFWQHVAREMGQSGWARLRSRLTQWLTKAMNHLRGRDFGTSRIYRDAESVRARSREGSGCDGFPHAFLRWRAESLHRTRV